MSKDYDPRMHSTEHILNQTMVRMFKHGRSFSNHIEKKKSKCDYHFERDLTPEEISEIENKVNSEIKKNHSVSEEYLPREIAEKEYFLGRLPHDAGDKIRIIKIGDYDACPCSGIHVLNTSEISEFKIISTGYDNGVLRIRFKLVDD